MGVAFKGIPFVDVVPEYRIRGENMFIDFGEYGQLAMPLQTFLQGSAKSNRVIAEHEAKRAPVIRLDKKKRKR